ncbi:MAG: hypothetical protein HQM06_13985 [Magnetococcales bacterium]|nr:hypothetical protein [Magnetococcales bacterium]
MSTFYLDPTNGNDANDGTSFANRWKTFTNGATAARIAPGDTIRVMKSPDPTLVGNGKWTCVSTTKNLAQNISSSTNATPIVATVTGHGFVTDDIVVVTSHTTNTNANGIWRVGTYDSNTFQLLNLDGTNSTGNGVGGTSGTVRKMTWQTVLLDTIRTKNIACFGNSGSAGRVNWTASTNVTCSTYSTAYKHGSGGVGTISIAVGASFTTGKAAYFPTGTIDLSGYQQVSFWIRQNSGTIGAAGACSLKLCTDNAGATPVHTIDIPALGALNQWQPITVDLGGNMNSAIQSIALYVNTDNGAQTFILDNIIACLASSNNAAITLSSLLGKNTSTESFYAIMFIHDYVVGIDHAGVSGTPYSPSASSIGYGYYGTTETVSTYKRETTKTTPAAATNTQVNVINDSGSSGSLINIEGGWDTTNMSTQDGETWLDGQNSYGYAIYSSAMNYWGINKFGFVRYNNAITIPTNGTAGLNFGKVHFNNNRSTVFNFAYLSNCYFDDVFISMCGDMSISMTSSSDVTFNKVCISGGGGTASINFGSSGRRINFTELSFFGCKQTPCNLSSSIGVIENLTIAVTLNGLAINDNGYKNKYGTITLSEVYNASGSKIASFGYNTIIGSLTANCSAGSQGVQLKGSCIVGSLACTNASDYGVSISSGNITILGGSTTGSGTASVNIESAINVANVVLRNFTPNEATVISGLTQEGTQAAVFFEKYAGTAGDNRQYFATGTIKSQSTTRHTASGYAWQFSPASVSSTDGNPLRLSVAKVAVSANSQVTVSAWMRRDNTGLIMRLKCLGGQLSGITNDITSSMTVGADTWEQVTIQFTPTEIGVVEIVAEAYGGTTYNGFIDDLTISQA